MCLLQGRAHGLKHALQVCTSVPFMARTAARLASTSIASVGATFVRQTLAKGIHVSAEQRFPSSNAAFTPWAHEVCLAQLQQQKEGFAEPREFRVSYSWCYLLVRGMDHTEN
jgi:hypothetical protein